MQLTEYDAVIIGTYTWGDGDIPTEMLPLYRAFENQEVSKIVTGIVGTGDRFYPNFVVPLMNLGICCMFKQILP